MGDNKEEDEFLAATLRQLAANGEIFIGARETSDEGQRYHLSCYNLPMIHNRTIGIQLQFTREDRKRANYHDTTKRALSLTKSYEQFESDDASSRFRQLRPTRGPNRSSGSSSHNNKRNYNKNDKKDTNPHGLLASSNLRSLLMIFMIIILIKLANATTATSTTATTEPLSAFKFKNLTSLSLLSHVERHRHDDGDDDDEPGVVGQQQQSARPMLANHVRERNDERWSAQGGSVFSDKNDLARKSLIRASANNHKLSNDDEEAERIDERADEEEELGREHEQGGGAGERGAGNEVPQWEPKHYMPTTTTSTTRQQQSPSGALHHHGARAISPRPSEPLLPSTKSPEQLDYESGLLLSSSRTRTNNDADDGRRRREEEINRDEEEGASGGGKQRGSVKIDRRKRSNNIPTSIKQVCNDCLAIPMVALVGGRQVNGFIIQPAPSNLHGKLSSPPDDDNDSDDKDKRAQQRLRQRQLFNVEYEQSHGVQSNDNNNSNYDEYYNSNNNNNTDGQMDKINHKQLTQHQPSQSLTGEHRQQPQQRRQHWRSRHLSLGASQPPNRAAASTKQQQQPQMHHHSQMILDSQYQTSKGLRNTSDSSQEARPDYQHYEQHQQQPPPPRVYYNPPPQQIDPFVPVSDEKCPMVGPLTVCDQINSYPADAILHKLHSMKQAFHKYPSFNVDSLFSDERAGLSEPFESTTTMPTTTTKTTTTAMPSAFNASHQQHNMSQENTLFTSDYEPAAGPTRPQDHYHQVQQQSEQQQNEAPARDQYEKGPETVSGPGGAGVKTFSARGQTKDTSARAHELAESMAMQQQPKQRSSGTKTSPSFEMRPAQSNGQQYKRRDQGQARLGPLVSPSSSSSSPPLSSLASSPGNEPRGVESPTTDTESGQQQQQQQQQQPWGQQQDSEAKQQHEQYTQTAAARSPDESQLTQADKFLYLVERRGLSGVSGTFHNLRASTEASSSGNGGQIMENSKESGRARKIDTVAHSQATNGSGQGESVGNGNDDENDEAAGQYDAVGATAAWGHEPELSTGPQEAAPESSVKSGHHDGGYKRQRQQQRWRRAVTDSSPRQTHKPPPPHQLEHGQKRRQKLGVPTKHRRQLASAATTSSKTTTTTTTTTSALGPSKQLSSNITVAAAEAGSSLEHGSVNDAYVSGTPPPLASETPPTLYGQQQISAGPEENGVGSAKNNQDQQRTTQHHYSGLHRHRRKQQQQQEQQRLSIGTGESAKSIMSLSSSLPSVVSRGGYGDDNNNQDQGSAEKTKVLTSRGLSLAVVFSGRAGEQAANLLSSSSPLPESARDITDNKSSTRFVSNHMNFPERPSWSPSMDSKLDNNNHVVGEQQQATASERLETATEAPRQNRDGGTSSVRRTGAVHQTNPVRAHNATRARQQQQRQTREAIVSERSRRQVPISMEPASGGAGPAAASGEELDPERIGAGSTGPRSSDNDGSDNADDGSSGQAAIPKPICRAKSIYISPRAALNDKKQWKYVVNAPERDPRIKQIIRVDICEAPFEACSAEVTLPFGFTSQCKQKYAKKKLLALDSQSGLLEVDSFFIPSCCVCQLIPIQRLDNDRESLTPIDENI